MDPTMRSNREWLEDMQLFDYITSGPLGKWLINRQRRRDGKRAFTRHDQIHVD